MNDKTPRFEPMNYSPFEPNYLRHYYKFGENQIKWDLEVEQPRRYVAGGIVDTLDQAHEAMEAAVEKDLKAIAKSFGL